MVSSSSIVDPSLSAISSAVGSVHDSRTVVQGSSVVNQFCPMVSTILSRSSSRSGHTALRQVRVHEVSSNQSTEEAISSVVDPRVQIQSSGPWSESQANSSWASQVEEGELADAEVAQRVLRVEGRLASLKSGLSVG